MKFKVGDDGELDIIEDYEEKPKRKRKRKPVFQQYLRGCLQVILAGVFFALSAVGGFAFYFLRNPMQAASAPEFPVMDTTDTCQAPVNLIAAAGGFVLFQNPAATSKTERVLISMDGRSSSVFDRPGEVESLNLAGDANRVVESRVEPIAPYLFIYTWTLDDTTRWSEKILTDGHFPAWSSDGKQIAFFKNEGADRYGLYIMNADGSNMRNLQDVGAVEAPPSWSPDGTQLVYSTTEYGDYSMTYNLYIINLESKSERVLLKNGISAEYPAWSPDGKSIAYRAHDLYTINVDGSNRHNLTNSQLASVLSVGWSPDSGNIVFLGWGLDQKQGIYMMDSDGSGLHLLQRTCPA